jgi:hypothetical protein
MLAFGGGQRGQQPVLHAGHHLVEPAELSGPGRGDGDDVAAAVGQVAGAVDQPTPARSLSAATTSLRSMLVRRPRVAWLAGPNSARAASRRWW